MALTISLDTGIGVSFNTAHAVIREFRMDKEVAEDGSKTFTITYNGLVYVDASKYTAGKTPVSGFNYQFSLDVTDEADQTNLLRQCYTHLKTQDGFTDGVDA
mgnify:FL=1|tara:strand:+ start:5531 stop:5836 length:306 start_codon:yes stop_codon:yes gene_type:complete